MLLAGDIGGTNTRLAIVSDDGGPRRPLAQATLPSAAHSSLDALVRTFLASGPYVVDRACFGVAGPVVEGRVSVTNLPWIIDAGQLQASLGVASVRLLNDVQALAYALPLLGARDLHTLNPGEALPHAALAVIAPGTGLGEAFSLWDGRRYRAFPSEGGHADFAPADDLQIGLLRYLRARFDHVSYERVCSGRGIPSIYAYLKESGFAEEPAWLAERLKAAEDPTPVIAAAALQDPPAALCRGAMEMFAAVLGAEAGNLALKVLATGGVYLGGGIPRRILSVLDGHLFLDAFRAKGRFAALMTRIPVHVILNADAALLGAAAYGLEHAREELRER